MNALAEKPHEKLQAMLGDDLTLVDQLISARMASDSVPRITEIATHLIGAGGKRLRPMLVLAGAKMFGYTGPYHIHLAATVEFIHSATLLHDDVVDASGMRRGKPTANAVWNNQSSVLVGDYLFARAFKLMVETESLRVLDILSNASAVIAEGEVLQLASAQSLDTSEETYFKIIRAKTAALFSAATQVGGVIANADEAGIAALNDYGDALGIAFQIADDLLDYRGGDEIGKNKGDDFREGKMSLPVIKAIAGADAQARAFWQRTIGKGQQEEGDFERALSYMNECRALEDTSAAAIEYSNKAKSALLPLPQSELRTVLKDMADYVVERFT